MNNKCNITFYFILSSIYIYNVSPDYYNSIGMTNTRLVFGWCYSFIPNIRININFICEVIISNIKQYFFSIQNAIKTIYIYCCKLNKKESNSAL
ncbi:hypothetical protein TRFO_33078 [Tritrichomonas foetus]|uniref:Uncharacterized protein n=1 Tax=Tritrichomonas foetus TaxID=1144522 RepID=A0A1J4JPD7_9EUKA|nr:hypothetical protein TRFO_33078 [Tritrichomonas foetus]|eukprot:OHT00256.1 hypothetical protein TRFO_33078 [Tritrichomonas foetus]